MARVLDVTPLPGYPEEIGRWLWALAEVRRGTVRLVGDLGQDVLDWQGADGADNAIGSLLYHIGRVEMSWLYLDILQQPDLPPPVLADFPLDAGGAREGLTRVSGVPLADHLGRLERVRARLFDAFRGMTPADWRHLREPADADYRVTPEWAIFHLVEHEAGHAHQIASIKRRAIRSLG